MQIISKRQKAKKLSKVVNSLLVLFSIVFAAPHKVLAEEDLFIAYPKEPAKVWASSSFIIGATKPGTSLKINDSAVNLNKEGFFAHVIKLNRGNNIFKIFTGQSAEPAKQIKVLRPYPGKSIPANQFKLKIEAPSKSQGLTPGDLLILKARATPQASLSVHLGKKVIHLSPAKQVKASRRNSKKKTRGPSPHPNISRGMVAAYGKVFQNLPSSDDLYVGFYKIQPTDNFKNLKPKFHLKKGAKSKTFKSNAPISVVKQPILAQTIKNGTVARVAPGQARLTPLVRGVRLMVDGWQGKTFRCLYGKNKHVWIEAKEIAFENGSPAMSGPPPRSEVKTVNLARSIYGDAIVIPLSQPLPYEVFQNIEPNKLVLKIYGATANTDWVSQRYRQAFEGEGSNTAGTPYKNPGIVESIDWKQTSDDVYELTVNLLGHRQWGHTVNYNGTVLTLHIKDPPRLTNPGVDLSGLKICVDPGHGGTQPGAMGCSGVSEARVNLAISLKLKKILEEKGASVLITRVTDKTLGLYERVDMARAYNADILLSVHNNSLPDGRDPNKEHGTSAYFYNKQAKSLAWELNNALVKALKFPNIGGRYQNLALTRPTQMLAVLVEIGFMINPDEYARLLKDETQAKAARAIVDGLSSYLSKTD